MRAKTILKQKQAVSGPEEVRKELKMSVSMAKLDGAKDTARVVDLAACGPVHVIRGSQGGGLLVDHECGPDTVVLESMTTGHGFSLSRDAARKLAGLLADWAGPEEPVVGELANAGGSWELAGL